MPVFSSRLLQQRDVDGAVGHVDPAPGAAGDLHVERLLEELRGLLGIGNDERDVAKLGHDVFLLGCANGMPDNSEERPAATRRAAGNASLREIARFGGRMYKDLREFIGLVDNLGALRRIEGADPRFEIGGITEVAAGMPDCPALLFDDIKGFPRGFRIFTNAVTQPAARRAGARPRPGAAAARRAEGLDGEAQDAAAARAGQVARRAVPGEHG